MGIPALEALQFRVRGDWINEDQILICLIPRRHIVILHRSIQSSNNVNNVATNSKTPLVYNIVSNVLKKLICKSTAFICRNVNLTNNRICGLVMQLVKRQWLVWPASNDILSICPEKHQLAATMNARRSSQLFHIRS